MPRHPYHLVDPSPWPFIVAMNILSLAMALLSCLHKVSPFNLGLWGPGLCLVSLGFALSMWWRDVVIESTHLGHHTERVQSGLSLGFILFLFSEVMFFFGLFWAFFHSALSPSVNIGCRFPPMGIEPINPMAVPLLNTALLLSSGVVLTWGHHAVRAGSRGEALVALAMTVSLGAIFTLFQLKEYYDAPFTISDGIYGSCFFVLTGFHGLHVIVGTIFLLVNLARTYFCHFSPTRHLGLDFAVWYWHFVDVIWIFLYLFLYWWGGSSLYPFV